LPDDCISFLYAAGSDRRNPRRSQDPVCDGGRQAVAFLSCLIYGGLEGNPLNRALCTLLLIGFLGALDEGIQSFMPYRTADLADWEFDMLAALCCVVPLGLLHALHLSSAQRHPHPPLHPLKATQSERMR
jgi:hypothetical protein